VQKKNGKKLYKEWRDKGGGERAKKEKGKSKTKKQKYVHTKNK
jgi:hypothetical protein